MGKLLQRYSNLQSLVGCLGFVLISRRTLIAQSRAWPDLRIQEFDIIQETAVRHFQRTLRHRKFTGSDPSRSTSSHRTQSNKGQL
ncbi:hypothetical protein BDV18DRAFT_64262 [Aspergillus unguis]